VATVAVATSSTGPVADVDQPLLSTALEILGIGTELVEWDDPSVDWDRFDLTVVRSTWDYADRRDEFIAWAASVPRLENPASVLAWSTDKHYLADLEAMGVPIVPTTFVDDVAGFVVPDADRFVVKPAVGAGSAGAARFEAHDTAAAADHLAGLLAGGGTALVQPYLEMIDEASETGVIVIDGEVSHAIAKAPMLGVSEADRSGEFRTEAISPRQPEVLELGVAERALRAAGAQLGLRSPLLYARVDLLPTPTGPVVIELELAEPSLFLATSLGSADRFAMAIAGALTRGSGSAS
jgi:glutathione synthase/RimK-type ligase-like ATP-grasp enzyme